MTTTAKIAATAYSTLEKTNQGSWWVRTSFTANTDAGITGKDMVTYRNSMWKRFNDAGGQVMGFTRCSYGDWQNVIRFSVRYRVERCRRSGTYQEPTRPLRLLHDPEGPAQNRPPQAGRDYH